MRGVKGGKVIEEAFPRKLKDGVTAKRSMVSLIPSGAYVTLYMRDCSHYEMRENKRHLSCGFPYNNENAT